MMGREVSLKKMVWEISSPDSELVRELSSELEISSVLATLLINRGVKSREEAQTFLSPRLESLGDPFLLKGMDEAVKRIKLAINRGERILVYGDYDADGVTATALLVIALREAGGNVEFYIPHRIKEGYGLNQRAVQKACTDGVGLIITADCGTNSINEVIEARRLGIEIIVTDHHEPDAIALPPAAAIINPRCQDSPGNLANLSGVGVVFKLLQALFGIQNIKEHLDLVSLGTVSDVASLLDENRVLVRFGLEELKRTVKPGLQALMQVAGMKGSRITSTHIAFILGPRLNAPGRIDSGEKSLELLLTESESRAFELACEVDRLNRDRQVIQRRMLKEACEKVEANIKEKLPPVIVLWDEAWHPGIVGIVAGKLSEDYWRPAVLIALEKESGRGSARSIEGFHILEALTECRKILKNFGGHEQAAGLSLFRKNVEVFREMMEKVGSERLKRCSPLPKLQIDMELDISNISTSFLEEMSVLEPYGFGNCEPKFFSSSLQLISSRIVGDRHVKMRLGSNGKLMQAIGFGFAEHFEKIRSSELVDIVYTPRINFWGGVQEVQLHIEDMRLLTGRNSGVKDM